MRVLPQKIFEFKAPVPEPDAFERRRAVGDGDGESRKLLECLVNMENLGDRPRQIISEDEEIINEI